MNIYKCCSGFQRPLCSTDPHPPVGQISLNCQNNIPFTLSALIPEMICCIQIAWPTMQCNKSKAKSSAEI